MFNEVELAVELTGRITKAIPDLPVRFDPAELVLHFGEDPVGTIDLREAIEGYREDEGYDQPTILDSCVRYLRSRLPTARAARVDNIYPVVRDRYEILSRGVSSELGIVWPTGPYPSEVVSDHLGVALAFGRAPRGAWLSHRHLSEFKLEFGTTLVDAKRRLAALRWVSRQVAEGVWSVTGAGDLSSSFLLLTERMREVSGSDAPIAAVPSRRVVLVADPDLRGAIGRLSDLAHKFFLRGMVSPNVFRLENETWRHYVPDDEPLRHLLRRRDLEGLTLLSEMQRLDYGDAPVLIPGPKSFATPCRMYPDGRFVTWWLGCNPLPEVLPEVDVVHMAGPQGSILVNWDDVMQLAGHLLEPVECYPRRYRATGYPDRDLVGELASRAIPFRDCAVAKSS